jgi:hydrogenase-4 component E
MTAVSNLLAFVALCATLLLVWRQSWRGRVRLFVLQSCVLAALAVAIGVMAERPALIGVGAVFAVIKTWLIPRVMRRMARGIPLRPVAPGHSAGLWLLAAGALVVMAYVVMLPITGAVAAGVPTRNAMPLAFAMALIGLFVCVTGRDALGQVIGFLVFENGLFALALLGTYGLPGLVEAGAFLEVLSSCS